MATVTERFERILEREAPALGVGPVPEGHRTFSGLDFAVLWGDLAIGLLVLLTGAVLVVPASAGGLGFSFQRALAAIAVGSLIGSVPLALVGLAGAREGVPGMVLFRPVLGRRGSYVPSILNVVQLVGWTGFEFWAMSQVADRMLHVSYWFWLAVVAAVCTLLALGGPILVVRRWLERFGAWVVAAAAAWITYRVVATGGLGAIWHHPGDGSLGFWIGVDLAVALPVSWLPLVADYNRFARRGVSSAAGTFWGYAIGNLWFYALGAMLVVGARLSDSTPAGLGTAIATLAGGGVVLLVLLVGETDEAFADIYSAAVSGQNLAERLPQRRGVIGVAAAGTALAVWLGLSPAVALGSYESFLFLLGSVFVPLFGVFVADYFLLGRRRRPGGRVNARAVAAWVLGFLVYQWSVPTGPAAWQGAVRTLFASWLHLPFPLAGSAAGASIPAFAAALGAHLLLTGPARGRSRAAA